MNKILITGATGNLGSATLDALLKRVPSTQLAALARDPNALAHRTAEGVDVRQGDYTDRASLVQAFQGVERALLVSAVAFTDRLPQHLNAIAAAKEAGVRHLVYTSIQRNEAHPFEISTVTESDVATERALADSGLDTTILQNPFYLESLLPVLGPGVLTEVVRVPAGEGRAALASIVDLAEANAAVLTGTGHEGRTYVLGGGETFSFDDVARVLSGVAGKTLDYADVSVSEFVAAKVVEGFPEPVAAFLAEWMQAIGAGSFERVTGDLERLIGRAPLTYSEFLTSAYRPQPTQG
ncbi:SDR family oxidoreductase [bacterium]|nr:MAG: SDR family oxidoreductase [bacterium]